MTQKIILVVVHPTVGKSTIAGLLSAKAWFAMDIYWMRLEKLCELWPIKSEHLDLYGVDGHDAVSFLTTFTAEQIADMEFRQRCFPFGGKKAHRRRLYMAQGFIIEGVNILPELIPTLQTSSDIRPVFWLMITKTVCDRSFWSWIMGRRW